VEILELAANAALGRIIPRHPQLAVRNDKELNKLLAGVTIAQRASPFFTSDLKCKPRAIQVGRESKSGRPLPKKRQNLP